MPVADAVDALSALAPLLRVRPELHNLCRFETPWASPHGQEALGWAPFHMVTVGSCVLDVGGDLYQLEAGYVALLPHGQAHVVRGAISRRDLRHAKPVRIESTGAIEVKTNSENPDVELICGRLTFEQAHDNFAKAALPQVIVVKTSDSASVVRLHALLITIRDELEAAEPGALSVSCDLAGALLMLILRVYLRRNGAGDNLLRLLSHRQTARLVHAIMNAPAKSWSLDTMAASAGLSRATLVREFRRLAKATPFDVLAEIRLGLARHALAATRRPIAEIAGEVGYASQAAFSRAFKRRFQQAPGAMR